MKKLIAAIVIASVGAAFAIPPYFVYDYKASIKRLDLTAKYVRVDGDKEVAQKFSVKSDTIQGFVTIPVCQHCNVDGEIDNSVPFNLKADGTGRVEQAFAYLTMKGNYKNVKDEFYYVLKTPVSGSIGVFGADQIANGGAILNRDNIKGLQAWMSLDFDINSSSFADASLVASKNVTAEVTLGLLGLGQFGQWFEVQNTGFGTIQNKSTANFCGGNRDCLTVTSISGTLVGYPMYSAACGVVPMWNLCDLDTEVQEAVISGTWSLKFNKAVTDSFNKTGANDEKAILKKFKFGSNDDKKYYQIELVWDPAAGGYVEEIHKENLGK